VSGKDIRLVGWAVSDSLQEFRFTGKKNYASADGWWPGKEHWVFWGEPGRGHLSC
jgi:hypothetical protein